MAGGGTQLMARLRFRFRHLINFTRSLLRYVWSFLAAVESLPGHLVTLLRGGPVSYGRLVGGHHVRRLDSGRRVRPSMTLVLDLDETLIHAVKLPDPSPRTHTAPSPPSDAPPDRATSTRERRRTRRSSAGGTGGANGGREIIIWGNGVSGHNDLREVAVRTVKVDVRVDERVATFRVARRPHLMRFLAEMYPVYEIVVYTAGRQEYADAIIDQLDLHTYVDKRFFRDSCVQNDNGQFVKDLRIVRHELSRVILVDDSPIAYSKFPENALPIQGWWGQRDDRALLDLIPLLLAVRKTKDVRHILSLRTSTKQPAPPPPPPPPPPTHTTPREHNQDQDNRKDREQQEIFHDCHQHPPHHNQHQPSHHQQQQQSREVDSATERRIEASGMVAMPSSAGVRGATLKKKETHPHYWHHTHPPGAKRIDEGGGSVGRGKAYVNGMKMVNGVSCVAGGECVAAPPVGAGVVVSEGVCPC
ncbi:unnamed protein product [Vitrella brassicaformis CCMP3155]|uniref:FCP1 homology domain-containing protein n=1 Tax=Vitrella brassicaformis (strain CCMP3155) TaxID=1169540 RepID=A0A0G4FC44_VITBC|nr:unnamed protein product [Vitrella brassicaformis CCMP3155]|eukprot:CEM10177.1 unnamed protein product [Vitrella brassicaformis CCMP3155]